MSVLSVYRSLTAEQKQLLGTKSADLNRPVDELLALLKPLAACDRMADKVRTKLGCTFGIGIVLTIALGIFFLNTGWGLVATVVFVAVVALMIGAGFFWSWTKRIDLSNNFRDFALPVLTVFREDFDASRPLQLHLDLSPPTSAKKKQSEGAPYAAGAYYKVIDTMYLDPWMSAEGTLTDGSKLSWSITETIRERKKTKRTPRGKIKTKTKYSKKTHLEVSLGLRKKAYDVVSEVPGAETTSDAKRNTTKVERQVKTGSLDPIAPNALIDLIADIYRSARPAKKEAGA